MATLCNKLGIFGEDGGSKVEENSEGGLGDWEDTENQLKKEPKKDQLNSSVLSQSLFKMEENLVDIKPDQDGINALKLSH